VIKTPADALHKAVTEVSRALAEEALTPLPIHRYPLNKSAEAHNAVEQGAVGKVVIEIP
jgi:NADPH2:quinone reductase